MLQVRFLPLPKWNRLPKLQGLRSQFKTSYDKTLDKLEYEIGRVDGHDVRIEAGYAPHQIRNDGWPQSKATLAHPACVLYFDCASGPLSFPCATYSALAANLHAIALTLECLRAVDRYGVTQSHQQYVGFAALPPVARELNVEEAAAFIGNIAGARADLILRSSESYRVAYRHAASKLHPDQNTDGMEDFLKLGQARQLLDAHHGLTSAGANR
jgi:hypothetical protein